jgi:hypothetical protein
MITSLSFRQLKLNVLGVAIAIFLFVTSIPALSITSKPWHAVLSCQSRTDITPVRPGFRLKLPDFRFENDQFTVENSYKEGSGGTVSEVWEGHADAQKLTISGQSIRNNSDSWAYKFSSLSDYGDMIELYGGMYGSDGKKFDNVHSTLQLY